MEDFRQRKTAPQRFQGTGTFRQSKRIFRSAEETKRILLRMERIEGDVLAAGWGDMGVAANLGAVRASVDWERKPIALRPLQCMVLSMAGKAME